MLWLDFLNQYVLHLSLICFNLTICGQKTNPIVFFSALIGCLACLQSQANSIVNTVFIASAIVIECLVVCDKIYMIRICICSLLSYGVLCIFNNTVLLHIYVKNFIFSVFFVIASVAVGIMRRQKLKLRSKEWINVKTYRGEKKLKMFVDSGNLLKKNDLPIIVIRAEDVSDIAPLNVLYALGLSNDNDTSRIYPISYKTLSGEGVIYGFYPDECVIRNKQVNCMIALSKGNAPFSGDCSALCNPNILEA